MWLFGFKELSSELKKDKRVKEDCKKFNDCDNFHDVVYEGFFVYALDEFAKQREELKLEESWEGFTEFLRLDSKDEYSK